MVEGIDFVQARSIGTWTRCGAAAIIFERNVTRGSSAQYNDSETPPQIVLCWRHDQPFHRTEKKSILQKVFRLDASIAVIREDQMCVARKERPWPAELSQI